MRSPSQSRNSARSSRWHEFAVDGGRQPIALVVERGEEVRPGRRWLRRRWSVSPLTDRSFMRRQAPSVSNWSMLARPTCRRSLPRHGGRQQKAVAVEAVDARRCLPSISTRGRLSGKAGRTPAPVSIDSGLAEGRMKRIGGAEKFHQRTGA